VVAAAALAAVALGVVLYIQTDRGTVKIDLEDPDAVVSIDGEVIRIDKLGEPITLRVGEHVLTVQHAGMEAETRKFTVKRGKREVLTVELKPKAPALKPGPAAADGFRPLFNGKDLTGWKLHPQQEGDWRVEDGVLTGRGQRSHLFSERGDYENFHFRVEAKINDGGNSGQFFRATFALNRQGYPDGYEAQINSTHKDPIRTGSLYGLVNVEEMLVKPDEWFTQEVIADGNHITIKVNGKTTVDYVDEKRTYTKGHLALQVLGPGTVVQFRKVEVKELPPSRDRPSGAEGFRPLFNGKDLAGWVVDSGARRLWSVEGGELVAAGSADGAERGWLLSEHDYSDFVLRFDFRLTKGGNSGVTFRAPPGAKEQLEIQLLDDPSYPKVPDTMLTGSLWKLAIDRPAALKPQGSWNTLEVEARGRSLRVTVNGQDTLNTSLDRFAGEARRLPALRRDEGRIGFQNWEGTVRFRNIRLQDLSAP
jgi:hypothetical protein